MGVRILDGFSLVNSLIPGHMGGLKPIVDRILFGSYPTGSMNPRDSRSLQTQRILSLRPALDNSQHPEAIFSRQCKVVKPIAMEQPLCRLD